MYANSGSSYVHNDAAARTPACFKVSASFLSPYYARLETSARTSVNFFLYIPITVGGKESRLNASDSHEIMRTAVL